MALRGKKHIEFPHMNTNIEIVESKVCNGCPFKVYSNKGDKVVLGTGNINGSHIFILPTYDYKASQGYQTLLSLLVKFFDEHMGRDLFEDVYVTRMVKCNHRSEHELYNDAVRPCMEFLDYEVRKLPARNVVFFGQAFNDYERHNDTVGRNIPFKNIFKAFSPAVLFYDNPKVIADFTEQINKVFMNLS